PSPCSGMVSDSLTVAGYRFRPEPISLDSPMPIVCPNCATSYRVEASSLGAVGRSVRCVRCRNVWFARDPEGLAAIARAHRRDVEAMAGVVSTNAASDSELLPEAPAIAREAAEPFAAEAAEPPAAEIEPGAPIADTASQFAAEEPLPQSQEPMAIAEAP